MSCATRTAAILVVDDDPGIRNLLRQVLGFEGYHVHTAADGREGLDQLRELDRCELLILDLMMPVMDGWEMYRRVREEHSNGVPIIIITAGELTTRAHKDFPDAEVIGKPFDLDRLLRAIERKLDEAPKQN